MKYGARSISSKEAQSLGYRIRGVDDQVHHPEGLLLPFKGEFGQLRPDSPVIPKGGKKPAKYMGRAGHKQTIAVFGDGDPVMATEGWKDALRLHLATGKTVCAIAGVSAWKLLPPSVKLLIYDADAAWKPGVWGALVAAGLDRCDLKLAFFPPVDDNSTAGACEFFRHHSPKEFEAIAHKAYSARELIHSIREHWSRDIRADLQISNVRALATIAFRAGFDENTVTLMVENAAKQNLKMRVELARSILKKVAGYKSRQQARRRKAERLKGMRAAVESASTSDTDATPPDKDDLGSLATRFGHIVLNELFDGGCGYASMGDTLYKFVGDHHRKIEVSELTTKIVWFASHYVVEDRFGQETIPYAAPQCIKEAIEFLLLSTVKDSSAFNPGGYVNCSNGVLQLSWGGEGGRTLQHRLIKHSPELIFTSSPGCAFNPEASPAEFQRLMECLTPEEGDMLMERFGASLDVPTIRRFRDRIPASFCLGDGNNGKDTLEKMLAQIVGAGAVSGCRISDFKSFDTGSGAGRFNLADLGTARVNISSENSAGVKIEHCESLKAAISGDCLRVEKKNVQSWAINPEAVMFFNFNKPPLIDAAQAAIGSRIDVFSFDRTYSTETPLPPGTLKADPRFKNDPQWVSAKVLPAMLNAMLAGLQHVARHGFTREPARAAMRRIQEESTHLVRLLEDLKLEAGTRKDQIGPRFGPSELWPYIRSWYVAEGWATWELDRSDAPTGQLRFTVTDRGAEGDPPIKAAHRIVALLKRLAPSIGTVSAGQGKKVLVGLKPLPGCSLAGAEIGATALSASPPPAVGSPGDPARKKQVTPDRLQQNQGDPSDPISRLSVESQKGYTCDEESAGDVSPLTYKEEGDVKKQGHQGHLFSSAMDLGSPSGSHAGSPGVSEGLHPWQQEAIHLAIQDPTAIPAVLVNRISIPPPGLTGRLVKNLLETPAIAAHIQQQLQQQGPEGEAA
ncbi:DUF5906 domain-containing protein [Vulcanococcus sp. Clear-D1]|uniref:DUF5906 domain-containing protein n=1 Tax=Vulcanococcus sp. Clear-D1 TaxID=2766970 RepID=UPI0019977A10|nr:DUF5906 domain-containing protein [Vulcanococcus sp. Clear-D1]MBD1194317.1 hypothetical protein [Vulcanococcus sp. Clear-D1]